MNTTRLRVKATFGVKVNRQLTGLGNRFHQSVAAVGNLSTHTTGVSFMSGPHCVVEGQSRLVCDFVIEVFSAFGETQGIRSVCRSTWGVIVGNDAGALVSEDFFFL